jgi:hypothetical protein
MSDLTCKLVMRHNQIVQRVLRLWVIWDIIDSTRVLSLWVMGPRRALVMRFNKQ